MIKYFVSYSYMLESNNVLGFGISEISVTNEIKSLEDIEGIQKEIDSKHPGQQTIILNIQKLPI